MDRLPDNTTASSELSLSISQIETLPPSPNRGTLFPYDESLSDAQSALKIYLETTPACICTPYDEFKKRLENPVSDFHFYLFSLKRGQEVVGMAMVSVYEDIMGYDYIALKNELRDKYSLYFCYIDMITDFVHEREQNINYHILEMSKSEAGRDRETQLCEQIFALKGYVALAKDYNTLPLGTQKGTKFKSYLYLKTKDSIERLDKEVFLYIIKNLYINYYCAWYRGILSKNEYNNYAEAANDEYRQQEISLRNEKFIEVLVPKFDIQTSSLKFDWETKKFINAPHKVIIVSISLVISLVCLYSFECTNLNAVAGAILLTNIMTYLCSRKE